MTREETLKHFKTWCQQTLGNNCSDKDLHMANNIMALLEQEPIIDEIRAEIEHLHDWAFSREEILRIIDKYRGESEGT